jgi:GNAT superfamily N-acetyltransferase
VALAGTLVAFGTFAAAMKYYRQSNQATTLKPFLTRGSNSLSSIREETLPMTQVRIAQTEEERQAIYRFRYRVYVEELGKSPPSADHANKILKEELDDTAVLLYAAEDGEIVGTLRNNFDVPEGLPERLQRVLELKRFGVAFAPGALSYTSRLMVAAERRHTSVMRRLVQAIYRMTRDRGVRLSFLHAPPSLVPLYEHLGFRRYTHAFKDEVAGQQVPMVIVVRDVEQLAKVRSPFYPIARETPNDPAAREWLFRNFPEPPPLPSSPAKGKTSMAEFTSSPIPRPFADYPRGSQREFLQAVNAAVAGFPDNPLCRKLDRGDFRTADYHAFLNMIFHQTYHAPSTFALAGANCDSRHDTIRDYLIEHAEEERNHWQWVLEDLANTGYRGPDPRSTFPHPACQAYVSFNTYLAVKQPVARLGTAAVLEGIGARYGKNYAEKLCSSLGLTPSQVKFVYGHGDTDVGHTADILRVLTEADLTGYDWAWLSYAARMAGDLYKQMYHGACS